MLLEVKMIVCCWSWRWLYVAGGEDDCTSFITICAPSLFHSQTLALRKTHVCTKTTVRLHITLSVPPCVPVLQRWHVEDPGHSAKCAGGRLHLNTHTPWTQWSWTGPTISLSRHSVGTYPEMSSHATCQGAFGHSHLSSLSHCGPIMA